MEQKTKKREWVKTVAIIFLSVLLVLTFFSKTIMNRSLPEVSTVNVTSGTINTKIRGTGAISANETYDVTIGQARKVQSVVARVGDEIKTGDTLFVLDPAESEELKMARDQLASMELSYQQALISAGNESATENREIQKLRDAYNEALEEYRFISSVDPNELKTQKAAAEAQKKALDRELKAAQDELTKAQENSTYQEYQNLVTELESKIETLKTEAEELETKWHELEAEIGTEKPIEQIKKELEEEEAQSRGTIQKAEEALDSAATKLEETKAKHKDSYDKLKHFATYSNGTDVPTDATLEERMKVLAGDRIILRAAIVNTGVSESDITEEYLNELTDSYSAINRATEAYEKAVEALDMARANLLQLQAEMDAYEESHSAIEASRKKADAAKIQFEDKQFEYVQACQNLTQAQNYVKLYQNRLDQMKALVERAQEAVEAQEELISSYNDASSAAERVKSAKEMLEDRLFTNSLGDPSYLTLQNQKDEIEKQKQTITELEANADALEVTAKVSGVISAVNITAGNTAQPETPLATITIKDRGYMVQIPATAEQARRVTVGDQATISNYYYGNITAELEKIVPDPKDPQKSRFLLFRLSGDGVEPGSNITLAIGQKSATYDAIVPSSAVRTDSNGTYVLVISEKRSPLGTRFIAKRADVTVIGSDDTSSAVSGVSNGDYVITTCTPGRTIEPGDQVRLVDES